MHKISIDLKNFKSMDKTIFYTENSLLCSHEHDHGVMDK